MDFQNRHSGIECCIDLERGLGWLENDAVVVAYADSGLGQGWEVGRLEGLEALRIRLGAAVAAHQAGAEENRNFRNHGAAVRPLCCGDFDGGDEVFLAVRTRCAYRQLASRENHRFGEVLEHETQGRSGVRHGIRAMEHHKTVVIIVFVPDYQGELLPQ